MLGDMACDRQDLTKGLEPDECFYIANEPLIREKERINLKFDPAPDLAVEVDLSSSSNRRMSIYASLGVPEVWRYDGRTLRVYILNTTGTYDESSISLSFPGIAISELAHFLDKRNELDANSLVREFQGWVRSQLAS
jgi:Uma2 family endonuclease